MHRSRPTIHPTHQHTQVPSWLSPIYTTSPVTHLSPNSRHSPSRQAGTSGPLDQTQTCTQCEKSQRTRPKDPEVSQVECSTTMPHGKRVRVQYMQDMSDDPAALADSTTGSRAACRAVGIMEPDQQAAALRRPTDLRPLLRRHGIGTSITLFALQCQGRVLRSMCACHYMDAQFDVGQRDADPPGIFL